MTTVAQLIDYLKTLPPETEVYVLRERSGSFYTYTEWDALNLEPYSGNAEILLGDLHLGER